MNSDVVLEVWKTMGTIFLTESQYVGDTFSILIDFSWISMVAGIFAAVQRMLKA